MKSAKETLITENIIIKSGSFSDRPIYIFNQDKSQYDIIQAMDKYASEITIVKDSRIEKLEELVKKIKETIPSTWLDPLLTGRNKVVKEVPYDCNDIENLFNAIRKQIAELEKQLTIK